MENKLIIKKAKDTDAAIVTQILKLAFQEFQEKYTLEAFDATVITPEKVKKRIKKGMVWIATLEDEPIATVSGKIIDATFYIQGMAVVPSARGKRVGYLLLQTVEDYAKQNHCTNLLLNTTPYLKKAIHLYEKFGFSIINEPPYELFKTPLFSMRKVLK